MGSPFKISAAEHFCTKSTTTVVLPFLVFSRLRLRLDRHFSSNVSPSRQCTAPLWLIASTSPLILAVPCGSCTATGSDIVEIHTILSEDCRCFETVLALVVPAASTISRKRVIFDLESCDAAYV